MRWVAWLATTGVVACGGDGVSGPGDTRVDIAAFRGNGQFGAAGAQLAEPLEVRVTDAGTGAPVKGVPVQWQVQAGPGASVTPLAAATDTFGIAAANLRLGPDLGTVVVAASASNMVGSAARFEASAVAAPEITDVTPDAAPAGSEVTITGRNFSAQPADNTVLFGRFRGQVLTATETQLRVTVPACAPSRSVDLVVELGAVSSTAFPIQTLAGAGPALSLQRGQVALLDDPTALDCVRLPQPSQEAAYLVVVQNAAQVPHTDLRFELHGLSSTGGAVTSTPQPVPVSPNGDFADRWEMGLRRRERDLRNRSGEGVLESSAVAAAPPPQVGDRRDFNVLKSDNTFARITAEITLITDRAIIYQDLQAPAGGFTAADFARFGQLFDDPIYSTDVGVFGPPSDIDGNGKIIILFTPQVNALTARSSSTFIVGFFYGCDLVAASICSGTNRSEIFYSLVPDPSGKFSDARSATAVLANVPSVLAHEFQHMINFAAKGGKLDDLWLSEALAHTAEDRVGQVFLERGDATEAATFQQPNYQRAILYLRNTGGTSMIDDASPGTLELRGVGWLFLKYLRGHYGGDALLRNLTSSNLLGAANIAAATGRSWSQLLAPFSVAIVADDEPALEAAGIDPIYTFPGIDLRHVLGQFQGGFPTVYSTLSPADFEVSRTLPAATQSLFLVTLPGGAPALHLGLSGRYGSALPSASGAQVSILRMQ